MTEAKFTKTINDRIDKLFDLYPIDDLRPSETTEAMKEGLAKAYADRGFRAYLENSLKIALSNMAKSPTQMEITYYKSRVDVLQQLLAKGKEVFTRVEVAKEMRKAVKEHA